MNSLIAYDTTGAWEAEASGVEELFSRRNSEGINWINVNSLDQAAINILAAEYTIHPLTIEDILDTNQRPKTEEFDDYLFIILKTVERKTEHPAGEPPGAEPSCELFDSEQVSIILKANTVITFQEKPGYNFSGLRKRIINGGGRLRRSGADYLAYSIMDVVVDDYMSVLDSLNDRIETLEDRASGEEERFITDFQETRQTLIQLRRYIWPLRESITRISHSETNLIGGELAPFFQDLHDNVINTVETIDNYRELLTGIMEMNRAAMSNRMNRIMKVLTIISTIFIPLTFIAGVYGMNFQYMPELASVYGYPVVLGVMILTGGGMLCFFRRRRWI